MADYLTKNRSFLFKIQAAAGTPEVPTVGADAILCEVPLPVPNFEVIQTNEVGAALDSFEPIVGGGYFGFTLDTYLKGAGTAGAAPEYGPLLRAAAMSETLTAANATTVAASPSPTSTAFALAAGSATDDAYVGMVIGVAVGGGAVQERIITDYVGASKLVTVSPALSTAPTASDVATLYANALYEPVSTALEVGTGYLYDHNSAGGNSLLRQMYDAASTWTLALPVRGPGKMSHTLRGILPASPTNVAHPGAATYDNVRPRPFLNASAYLGGAPIKFNQLDLNYGGTMEQADCPQEAFGYATARVVTRRITGSINPQLELLSVRNNFNDFIAGTARSLWVMYGSTPGNRVSIYCPALRYTGANPADIRGFNSEALPFEATGFDTGVYLSLF